MGRALKSVFEGLEPSVQYPQNWTNNIVARNRKDGNCLSLRVIVKISTHV